MKSWASGSLSILLKIFKGIAYTDWIWYSSGKSKIRLEKVRVKTTAGAVIYLEINRIINIDHVGRISQ